MSASTQTIDFDGALMTSKKEEIKDPFQLLDDTSSSKPSTKSEEEKKQQREKMKQLVEDADIGLTAQIKKELQDKKKRKEKLNQLYESSDIGLTAKIRMGIEEALEKDDDNIADKYGYDEESSDVSSNNNNNQRSVWNDYLSPTAQIKKSLAQKGELGINLGLTEKIAKSLLGNQSDTGEYEVKTSIFWDLVILVVGLAITIGVAVGIIMLLEKLF